MKLLVATQNFTPAIGGIEEYGRQLVQALVLEGAEVSVLAPAHVDAAAHDAALGCEVVRYAPGPARELGVAGAILLAGRQPHDAVLCLQWSSAIALAASRVPFGIVCHGKEIMPIARSGPRESLERFARAQVLGRASHVFAVSHFSAKHAVLAGALHARTRVINPGVDAARFAVERQPPPAAPRLLTVARLVERKGVDTVLRALPAIARAHDGVRYAIAGEGPDRARLDALARTLGVEARIDWLGRVAHAELPQLYASADLFVLPSRSLPEQGDVEGFGLVLLEAQATGTPVVAARSGGMPDSLEEGQTGVLVEPSDPEALASAVIGLLSDRPRLARMGQAARARATTRSWRAVAREMLDAFASGGR
jgi:phosphatidylinositol alpha-1,6-mannosyltransferase